MRLLGLDYETTGLSPEKDTVTEIGAVIWDTVLGGPVEIHSMFLDYGIKEMDPIVTKLTGITPALLEEFGVDPSDAFEMVNARAVRSNCSAFVAHNGTAFDSLFYAAAMRRHKLEPVKMLWVDTQNDIPYGDDIKTRKLTHLACEHGFLNPFAHRAVFDVLTMFKVLENYDIDQVLKLAAEPVVYLKAEVSFQNKALASSRGYRWSPGQRTWWRSFKLSQVAKEKAECGFTVREINKPPDEA